MQYDGNRIPFEFCVGENIHLLKGYVHKKDSLENRKASATRLLLIQGGDYIQPCGGAD